MSPASELRRDRDPGEEEARGDLAALLAAEVEIEAVLGEKRVPLGDLSNLAVGGDLLLLARDRAIRLVAGGVEIGEGTAVEVGGRLALRVDRVRPFEEFVAELGGNIRALLASRDDAAPAPEASDGGTTDPAEEDDGVAEDPTEDSPHA